MGLNDAINHLKESLADPTHKWGCEKCKAEHEQLLEWLEDYKQLKSDYIDLDNRLRTANTEIDRLQSVSSLIPCSERLPEKDGNYLCISNNEYKILPYRNGDFYCICFDAVLRCCNSSVTHWMPLPEIPKRKDDTHDND